MEAHVSSAVRELSTEVGHLLRFLSTAPLRQGIGGEGGVEQRSRAHKAVGAVVGKDRVLRSRLQDLAAHQEAARELQAVRGEIAAANEWLRTYAKRVLDSEKALDTSIRCAKALQAHTGTKTPAGVAPADVVAYAATVCATTSAPPEYRIEMPFDHRILPPQPIPEYRPDMPIPSMDNVSWLHWPAEAAPPPPKPAAASSSSSTSASSSSAASASSSSVAPGQAKREPSGGPPKMPKMPKGWKPGDPIAMPAMPKGWKPGDPIPMSPGSKKKRAAPPPAAAAPPAKKKRINLGDSSSDEDSD